MHYLLLNLAVADIIVGIFALPGPYDLGPYLYTHPRGTLGDGSIVAVGNTVRSWEWDCLSTLSLGQLLPTSAFKQWYIPLQ